MSHDLENGDIRCLLRQAHDTAPPEPDFVRELGEQLQRERINSRAESELLPIHAPRQWRRRWMLIPATAAAVALVIASAYFLRRSEGVGRLEMDVDVVQVNPKVPDCIGVPKTRASKDLSREGPGETMQASSDIGSYEEMVAEATAIVVATALEAVPAPAKRAGDRGEFLVRYQVKRVLKGKWADKVIFCRKPGGIAAELIGRDWVVMLSPEYVAGTHQMAASVAIQFESEIRQILALKVIEELGGKIEPGLKVDLGSRNVVDDDLKNIGDLKGLRFLNLRSTAIGDKGLTYLQDSERLEIVDVASTSP